MDLAQVDHESASVLLDSPSDAMDKPEHDVIVVGAGNPTLCAAGEMPDLSQSVVRSIVVASLLLALIVESGPLLARAENENAVTIRVVTFNLLHGGPWSGLIGNGADLDTRLAMVIEQLASLRPDVVGLQEASLGRKRGNVAERLGRALGLEWVHAPTTSQVFGVDWLDQAITSAIRFNEGPAVLSRFPVVSSEIVALPRCTRRLVPRVLLRVEVRAPWGPLDIYSTHTSRDDCQVRRVAELVRARRGLLPAFLTGDFNTVERSDAYAELIGAGFVDAFRAANPHVMGPTVLQRVDAAEPTVSRRIDFVFVVPGTSGVPRVLESRVVLDIPRRRADGTTLWPSDHYGVLAVIEVPTNGAR
jgi:endonuclease/exonuclease/phosphatase family metal-dependent hydrolase